MTLVPTIRINPWPKAIRALLEATEWTPKVLDAMIKCADQNNGCHGCGVKDNCRQTYDWLLEKTDDWKDYGSRTN